MIEWTRRSFLTLGAGLFASVTGCAGNRPLDTGTDTTEPTTTAQDGSISFEPSQLDLLSFNHAPKLHRLKGEVPQRDVANYYLGLLTADHHGEAFPNELFEAADATGFLDRTDFSQAVVVVLQDRTSSSRPDFELVDVSLDDAIVTVEAKYPGQGGTSDVTTDTLVVRVPTGKTVVQGARAIVHPQTGDTVRFSTANVYEREPGATQPGDIVLRNRDCTEHTLGVTVTHEGELFVRERLPLGPATQRRFSDVVSRDGEWTLTVQTGGESVERTWTVTDGRPGDLLVDVAGDRTVSLSRVSSGVEAGVDTCDTDGYPYESETPEENLEAPIDLWLRDAADASSTLTVTVTDGDAEVFQRRFVTRTGTDKIHRPGLLAKQTTYTVTVTAENGRSVAKSVTVTDGSDRLVVRVTGSNELAISLE